MSDLIKETHGILSIHIKDKILKLDTLTDIELRSIAEGILAFLDGDNSIE
jgi:hypothetical protein